MTPPVAVLTGDLIGSTLASAGATTAAMQQIEAIAKGLEAPFEFVRFRGDGWQLYLEKAGLGLATALLITAALRAAGGLETRIAIGLGDARLQGTPTAAALGAATGTAFTASGRALDTMPKDRRLALAGTGVDKLHQRLVAMIDARIMRWSREQAEVLETALGPNNDTTQEGMAARHGITRQAVAARLQAAEFRMINAAAVDFLSHFGDARPFK
jgi:hypothetical protein